VVMILRISIMISFPFMALQYDVPNWPSDLALANHALVAAAQ
jgi:hypothetical protein